MRRPGRLSTVSCGILGALALLAAPAAAGPRWPNLALGIGGTAMVSGTPDGGGFAAWGAAVWPVDERWSFGLHAYADDMGDDLVQAVRPGVPPEPLGTVEERHRYVYGGGWRIDAALAPLGRWEALATGTWSYARIQDDARGTITGAESANAFGIGLGIRRPVLQHSTVGVALRYHHLFSDTVEGYMSAGVEWGWRFGKTP